MMSRRTENHYCAIRSLGETKVMWQGNYNHKSEDYESKNYLTKPILATRWWSYTSSTRFRDCQKYMACTPVSVYECNIVKVCSEWHDMDNTDYYQNATGIFGTLLTFCTTTLETASGHYQAFTLFQQHYQQLSDQGKHNCFDKCTQNDDLNGCFVHVYGLAIYMIYLCKQRKGVKHVGMGPTICNGYGFDEPSL